MQTNETTPVHTNTAAEIWGSDVTSQSTLGTNDAIFMTGFSDVFIISAVCLSEILQFRVLPLQAGGHGSWSGKNPDDGGSWRVSPTFSATLNHKNDF